MVRGAGFTASLGVDYVSYSSTGEVCGIVGDITGECLVAVSYPDRTFAGLFLVTYATTRTEDGTDYVDGEYLRDGVPVDPESLTPVVVGISDIRG